MRLKYLDLILLVTIAVMNIIWALLPNHLQVVGVILSIPLVFIIPGYAITQILSKKLSLEALHRFIFSFGLSLVVDILSGFILNLFPVGLRALSWAVFLGLITTVLSFIIAYYRYKSPFIESYIPKFRFKIHECFLMILALILAIFSLIYSFTDTVNQPHPGYTQLWILSSTNSSNNCFVQLGVKSFEMTTETYSITLLENGIHVKTWPAITLDPQQEWSPRVSLIPKDSENIYIEVNLYLKNKPDIAYREVHMTLNGSGGSKHQTTLC